MAESVTLDIHSLAQFIEETLTHDPKDPQRLLEYIRECHHIGIDVLPFDINLSESSCNIEEEQAIRVGFSLIVPENAGCIKTILAERTSQGAFTSFQDFCERLDIEKIPNEFLLRAIQIGGFDLIEASRSALFYGRQTIIQHVQNAKEEKATGQFSLFAQPTASASAQVQLPVVEEWTKEQRITQEEDALGFSFEECLLNVDADEEETEVQQDDVPDDVQPTSEPEPEEASASEQPQAEVPDNENEPQPTPETIPERTVPAEPVTHQPAVPIVREPPTPIRETEDEWKDTDTPAPKEREQETQQPQLVIRLSTLITTEHTLTRLKAILQQYPGTIPVHFHCINLENQATVVPVQTEYSVDASEDCLAAIAAITGYHAITFAG